MWSPGYRLLHAERWPHLSGAIKIPRNILRFTVLDTRPAYSIKRSSEEALPPQTRSTEATVQGVLYNGLARVVQVWCFTETWNTSGWVYGNHALIMYVCRVLTGSFIKGNGRVDLLGIKG